MIERIRAWFRKPATPEDFLLLPAAFVVFYIVGYLWP